MRENKHFALLVAAVVALVSSSAFAESRPSNETRARGESRGRQVIERNRAEARTPARDDRSVDRNRSEARDRARDDRSTDRNRAVARDRARDDRSTDRNRAVARDRARDDRSTNRNRPEARNRGSNDRDRSRSGDYRNNSRGRSDRGGSYGNRQPYYAHGRISRMHRYGSGYRIWVIGAPYPFFVPDAYYHHNRFRIGLSIRLGGYYNPLGYYDYYDGYNSSYARSSYSSATLRGVVESVDDRRGTFVIRNDATGSFVTIAARRDVRPGDYVEVYGDWGRSGLFEAREVDLLDNRDDRRYDDQY